MLLKVALSNSVETTIYLTGPVVHVMYKAFIVHWKGIDLWCNAVGTIASLWWDTPI